jgi:hypothetical protein
MLKTKAVGYLILAQICFFGFLMIAIIMTPAAFSDNHGLSYYGEHKLTAIPYGLGFLLGSFFLMKVTSALPAKIQPFKNLAVAIQVLVLLLIGVFLTPGNLNRFFDWAHNIVAAGLFIFELGLALWLIIWWYKDLAIISLFIIQLIAGLVAMLSQLDVIYYLSEGILIFQLSFGLLFTREIAYLLAKGQKESFKSSP